MVGVRPGSRSRCRMQTDHRNTDLVRPATLVASQLHDQSLTAPDRPMVDGPGRRLYRARSEPVAARRAP